MPTSPRLPAPLRSVRPLVPVAVLALASCVRAPAETPSPARTGDAPATVSAPAAGAARRWAIVRAPATFAWQVETVAWVEVTPDTSARTASAATVLPAPGAAPAATPGSTPAMTAQDSLARTIARDSVRSHAAFVATLADTTGGLALRGTLDSLVVLSPRAPARRPILAPVPIAGLLDTASRRLTIAGEADSAAACSDPSRGAALLVRELVVALPRTLEPGQRWSESTVTVTCRANVPVTSRATHDYTVVALEDRAGVPAIAVRRSTRAMLSGAATLRGSALSLTGETNGEATLSVDPRDGRLHASTGSSTTRLTITTDGASRDVTQSATTRVTSLPR